MTRDELIRRRDAVAAEHGPWVGHNIHLGHDVYTIGERVVGAENTAKHLLDLVGAIARKPIEQLRILDLGCSEGLYAIEFGLHGAEVVGVEGRAAPLARARFAAAALGLGRVRFEQGDAREATEARHGRFDVILNCGLLYHLDAPDIFRVFENMAGMCDDLAIVETHYAQAIAERFEYKGEEYFGVSRREHEDAADAAVRESREWASLDNAYSFWMAKPSLVNALVRSGFAAVTECLYPAILSYGDRETFIARKGEARQLKAVPLPGIFEDRFLPPVETRRPLSDWVGQDHVDNPATTPRYFDTTTRDLDAMRRRLDAMDGRFDGVDAEMRAIDARVAAIGQRLDEATPEIARLAGEAERLAAYSQSLQGSMNDWLNGLWTALNTATAELGRTREEIERIRIQQRRPWFMRRQG